MVTLPGGVFTLRHVRWFGRISMKKYVNLHQPSFTFTNLDLLNYFEDYEKNEAIDLVRVNLGGLDVILNCNEC